MYVLDVSLCICFIIVFFVAYMNCFDVGSGLKADEKLINLGSRNFFMCSKPSTSSVSVNLSSCSEEANLAITFTSPFPLTRLMDFLL